MNNLTLSKNFSHASSLSQTPSLLIKTRWSGSNENIPQSSIQKAFQQLKKDPLFQTSNALDISKKHSTSTSWMMARVNALFNAVYQSGVSTKEDLESIQLLLDEVETLKKNLENTYHISKKEKDFNQKCIKLAKEALSELATLGNTFDQFYAIEERLDKAIAFLSDRTFAPFYPGEELLAGASLDEAISSFFNLKNQIESLPLENTARIRLQANLDKDLHSFILTVSEWQDSALDSMKHEAKTLFLQLKKFPENKAEIISQLSSLNQQQHNLQAQLNSAISLLNHHSKFAPLSHSFKQMKLFVEKEAVNLQQAMKKQKICVDLAPLEYGGEEWMTLMAKRPEKKISALKNFMQTMTQPESWNESTKTVVHTLLLAMQLGQLVIQDAQSINLHLKDLQKNIASMIARVPLKTQQQINRDSGMLGTLLFDKYDKLFQNPKLIDKFSKENPALHKGLTTALHQFGQKPPTRDEVMAFRNAYEMKQLAAAIPSSFTSLSFHEWWTLFTTTNQIKTDYQDTDTSLSQYQVITSPKKLPLAEHRITITGSTWYAPKVHPSSLIENETAEGLKNLEDAMEALQQRSIEVNQDLSQITGSLKKEIELLQHELIKTSQKTPNNTCSLVDLAVWAQEVSDKCYAVKYLENQINKLMAQAKETLSKDNAELEKYGKKHANLILQARLVEGLKLEGIVVPVPQGISSDDVLNFLKQQVPEIFIEWEALGQAYHHYQAHLPFLEDPNVKTSLKKIQNNILRAFKKASKDKKLFSLFARKEFIQLMEALKNNHDYFMVRSTGKTEDSHQTALAGCNVSRAYVAPTQEEVCQAIADVVVSYFSIPSLQNRINVHLNPFEGDLNLAVTAQQLIGEPIGGSPNANEIPLSLVLFTSEPLYIGNEKFRTMRISATYGHGEGVVGGLGIATDTALLLISEAHPDQLYILYDNVEKPERLAPIRTSEGISLQPVDNPEHLKKQAVLNPELLSRLYTWGVVGEKFFDDYPTDMEIVIKNGTIYPVQARPIIRPDLLPTYLDMKKINSDHSPIIETMRGEMLVPGKSSVIVIKDPKQIRFSATLKEAEEKFNKEQHLAVIVTKSEPANSHPVVNFSGLGMPCLVFDKKVEELIEKASSNHPIVICIQTGTVSLWDESKENIESFIAKGFTVHPAKISMSLPIDVQAKTLHTSTEAPQDVKDLLLSIRSAKTNKIAKESLAILRQHPFVTSIKAQQIELGKYSFVPRQVSETTTLLQALDTAIDKAFHEVEAVLNNTSETERLQPLLHIKILETLLLEDQTPKNSLNQYSRLTVTPLFTDAKSLVDYQKKFSHPVHFSRIYLAADQAFEPSSKKAWRDFIEKLEPQVVSGKISQKQVRKLHKMINILERTKLLETWLAFFFKGGSLQEIFQILPVNDEVKIEKILKLIDSIDTLKRKVDAFSDPHTFKHAWKQLQKLTQSLMLETGPDSVNQLLKDTSPIIKLMLVNTLLESVDFFDAAIKQMKASSKWEQEEKIPLFKEMLTLYFSILESFGTNLGPSLSIPMHEQWPLNKYLETMKDSFNQLPNQGADQTQPSPNFSVSAAMFGAITAFERHSPGTLEDFFTLVHQNLLSILSNLNQQIIHADLIKDSALPKSFKEAIRTMDNQALGHPLMNTGVEISDTEVKIKYNIPLRNHSAKIILVYNKIDGKTTLQGFLLGEARERWTELALMADLLNDANILSLTAPVQITEQEVNFIWDFKDQQIQQTILEEFGQMCSYSLHGDFVAILVRLFTRQKKDVLLVEKAIHLIHKLVKQEDIPRAIYLFHSLARNTYGLEQMILTAQKGTDSSDENILHTALLLLTELAKMGQSLEQAALAAQKGINDPNENVRRTALSLFTELVKNGQSFEQAALAAQKAVIDPNQNLQHIALPLFTELVKNGQSFEQAALAAQKGIDAPIEYVQRLALSLLIELVKNGQNLEQAALIAETAIKNEALEEKTFVLFKSLFEKGVGYQEAAATAQKGITDPNYQIRQTALSLYKILIEEDYKTKEVASAAAKAINHSDSNVRHSAFLLFHQLFAKGLGFEEGASAAAKAINHSDSNVRYSAFLLFHQLFAKGLGFEEAASAAQKGFMNPDDRIHDHAMMLFRDLFKMEMGFKEAISVADQAIKETDSMTRRKGINLYYELVRNGQAFEEAAAAIEKGLKDSDPSVISLAQALSEILYNKTSFLGWLLAAIQKKLNDFSN